MARQPTVVRYIWGGLDIPSQALEPHYAVIGSVGSGKTLLIRMLAGSVLPKTGGGLQHRAIIYDYKRELYPLLVGMGIPEPEISIMHPFDARSVAWDMARDIDTASHALELASILAPVEERSTQPFFATAARDLLRGVLLSLQTAVPGEWTLNDVLEASSSQGRLQAVLRLTTDGQDLIHLYLENAAVTASNIVSTLRAKLSCYESVARAWTRASRRMSLRDWFDGRSVLLLGADETTRTALDAINQAMFKRASELVTGRPDERVSDETWVFLDETREAGRLSGLRQLLTTGRSKGAHVVLGFQDLDGLRDVYGREQAEELVGVCGNVAMLRVSNPGTADWGSRYFGEYEYIKRVHGESHSGAQSTVSWNDSLERKPAILPQQFMLLQPASHRHGIDGVFATPRIGAWRATIPPEFISKHLHSAAPLAGHEPRPASDEMRHPWTADDLKRFGVQPVRSAETAGLRTLRQFGATERPTAAPRTNHLRDPTDAGRLHEDARSLAPDA